MNRMFQCYTIYQQSLCGCSLSLFKWWCHLHYWLNNSRDNSTIVNLVKNLLKKIPDRIRYCIKMVPVCMVHVCSSDGATLIIG